MNHETFQAMKEILTNIELQPNTTNVRAANQTKIEFEGMINLKFQIDDEHNIEIEHPIQYSHTFWIAKKGQIKSNIIGMDWLLMQCKSMTFGDNCLILKQYPKQGVQLASQVTTIFPFFETLQAVQLQKKENIDCNSIKKFSIKMTNAIEKDSHFYPNKILEINGIEHIGPYFATESKEFPLLCKSSKSTDFSLPRLIGFTAKQPLAKSWKRSKRYTIINPTIEISEIGKRGKNDWFIDLQNINDQKIIEVLADEHEEENEDDTILEIQKEANKEATKKPTDQEKCEANIPHQIGGSTLYQIWLPQEDNKNYKEFTPINHNIIKNLTRKDKIFLNKFDFTKTTGDSKEIKALFYMLISNMGLFSQHKYDVGKTDEKFQIKLYDGKKPTKQRPSRVPIQHAEKLKKTLKLLLDNDIIKEVKMDEKNGGKMGSECPNPIIIITKGSICRIVIDARLLNSCTDTEYFSWPVEALQDKLMRINGDLFCLFDLNQAFHQASMDEGKYGTDHTSFVIQDNMYYFNRGFYGLKGLPSWFSALMRKKFAPLIEKNEAMTYLDDVLLMGNSIPKMFKTLEEFFECLKKAKIKIAPEKAFFFQKQVQYLGHIITQGGRKPIRSRVIALKNLKSPETRKQLMSVLGKLNYYAVYFTTPLHRRCSPLHKKANELGEFIWEVADEKIFRDILQELCEETLRIIPNENCPFEIYVDSSNVGVGCILVNIIDGKRKIVSLDSRCFDTGEQKLSTIARELAGLVWSLHIYDFMISGTKFPLKVYTDHKPILYLFGKKGQLNHRLFKYQLQLTKYNTLEIHWIEGKKLPLPDELSRSLSSKEVREIQLNHKNLPKELKLFKNGIEIEYTIEHSVPKIKGEFNPDDIFPIIRTTNGKRERLQYTGKEMEEQIISMEHCEIEKCVPLNVIAKMGRQKRSLIKQLGNEIERIEEPEVIITLQEVTEIEEIEEYRIMTRQEAAEHGAENMEPEEFGELVDSETRIEPREVTELKIQTSREFYEQEINVVEVDDFEQYNIDITLDVILMQQKSDIILNEVRSWMQKQERPTIRQTRSQPILNKFGKLYDQLYLCPKTGLLYIFEQATWDEITENDNTYFTKPKIVLPMNLIIPVFNKYHDGKYVGHMGIEKTLTGIKEIYYVPGLFKWVKALIKGCIGCQENKHVKKKCQTAKLASPIRTINAPWQNLHIDYKGPLNPGSFGNQHILMMVDTFTKFIIAYPTANTTARTTIIKVTDMINKYGIPASIVCDRGTSFHNHEFVAFCECMGIKLRFLSGYNPQANGQIEVYNKYVAQYLRITSDYPRQWATLVGAWTHAINTSTISHSTMTAHELLFGQKPNITVNMRLGKGNNEDNVCDPEDSDYEDVCSKLPPHNHAIPNILTTELKAFNKNKEICSVIENERKRCVLYKRAMKMLKIDDPDVYKHRNIQFTGTKLKLGDLAMIENKKIERGTSIKLLPLRNGIFRVVDICAENTYILENLDTRNRIMRHRNLLLPYNPLLENIGDLTSKYPNAGTETEYLFAEEDKRELYRQKIIHASQKLKAAESQSLNKKHEFEPTFDWKKEFRQMDEYNLLDKLDTRTIRQMPKSYLPYGDLSFATQNNESSGEEENFEDASHQRQGTSQGNQNLETSYSNLTRDEQIFEDNQNKIPWISQVPMMAKNKAREMYQKRSARKPQPTRQYTTIEDEPLPTRQNTTIEDEPQSTRQYTTLEDEPQPTRQYITLEDEHDSNKGTESDLSAEGDCNLNRTKRENKETKKTGVAIAKYGLRNRITSKRNLEF